MSLKWDQASLLDIVLAARQIQRYSQELARTQLAENDENMNLARRRLTCFYRLRVWLESIFD